MISYEILLTCGLIIMFLIVVYSFILYYFLGIVFNKEKGQVSFLLRLIFGAFNAMVIFALAFHDVGSILLGYVGVCCLLFVEFYLLFRADIRNTFLVTITIGLHIMCLHTVCCAGVAIAKGSSMNSIGDSPTYYLISGLISILLLIIATILAIRKLPIAKLRVVMQQEKQRNFLSLWILVCVLYMLYNAKVFSQDVSLEFLYWDQVIKCATILLGVYVMLFYNFRVNELLGYKEKSELLSTQLNKNLSFLKSITSNAERKYEINLTRNRFTQGLHNGQDAEEMEYQEHMSVIAKNSVIEEDLSGFLRFVDCATILKEYAEGITTKAIDYRVKKGKNGSHWYRMKRNVIFDEKSKDVKAIAYVLDVQEEMEAKRLLQETADQDLLTGLYNRRGFERRIKPQLDRGIGILVMIDIDDFKWINDLRGHDKGDEALKELGRLLKEAFGEEHIVGRFGGDEFMIYVRNTWELNQVVAKLQSIQQEFTESTRLICEDEFECSLSIGITLVKEKQVSFMKVYKEADKALYEQKKHGKNGYSVFNKH